MSLLNTLASTLMQQVRCNTCVVYLILIILALLSLQAPVSFCPVPWMWKALGFGSLTYGTTPWCPTCWRL